MKASGGVYDDSHVHASSSSRKTIIGSCSLKRVCSPPGVASSPGRRGRSQGSWEQDGPCRTRLRGDG